MRNEFLWKLVPVVMLGGCFPSAVNFAQVNLPPAPMGQHPAGEVAVFSSGPPQRPHVDVGVIEAIGGSSLESFESLAAMARTEAGRRGCDALVLNPVAFTGEDSGRRVVSGTCVLYLPARTEPQRR
jgi:hypothetical protein